MTEFEYFFTQVRSYLFQTSLFLILYFYLRWVFFGSKAPFFLPGFKQFYNLAKLPIKTIRKIVTIFWKIIRFCWRITLRFCRVPGSANRIRHQWQILNADSVNCPHCHLSVPTEVPTLKCSNHQCQAVNTAVHIMEPCHFCGVDLIKRFYNCPYCSGSIPLFRNQRNIR